MTRINPHDMSLENYGNPRRSGRPAGRADASRVAKHTDRPRAKPALQGRSIVAGCAIVGALFAAIAAPVAQEYLQQQGQPKLRQAAPAHAQPTAKPKAAAPAKAQQVAAKPAAQELVTTVGDWSIKCVSAPTRTCQLSQRQLDPNTKGLLIWVELTQAAGPQKNSALAIMTPLGMRLPPALSLQADRNMLAGVPIVTCMQLGCLHSGPFAGDSLVALQRAQTLSTQVTDMQNRTFAIQLSTRGLSEASTAINEFLKSS